MDPWIMQVRPADGRHDILHRVRGTYRASDGPCIEMDQIECFCGKVFLLSLLNACNATCTVHQQAQEEGLSLTREEPYLFRLHSRCCIQSRSFLLV